MTTTLFTIGYEGAELDHFIATLTDAGVTHVVDIRDVPASRKRGFSKSALASALASHAIEYTHLKALGDPKAGREAMRRDDYDTFLNIYSAHVEQPAAQDALKDAANIATAHPSVLLCYERDPKQCHRTLVAGMMKELASFTIRHLGVNPLTVGADGRIVDGAGSGTAYTVG